MNRPSTGKAFPSLLCSCLTAGLTVWGAACSNVQLVSESLDLPPDAGAIDPTVEGPETIVVRHAGPVWVFRPGANAGYILPYYRKRERVVSASDIRVGWGGRAELIWPGDATSVVLFEEARITLGDPSRDEPLIAFKNLTRVQLILTPEDRIVLIGGAELRGDPVQPSGPFLLERTGIDLLRATNQSKFRARLLYRDAVLELAPGDSIDLPLLSMGTAPYELDPGVVQLSTGGRELEVLGTVESVPGTNAVSVKALALSEVSAQGVQILMERDETAVFSSLQGNPVAASVDVDATEQP